MGAKKKDKEEYMYMCGTLLSDDFRSVPPRYLAEKNLTPLRNQLEVTSLDMSENDSYRLEDNLEDSRVLGDLLLK